MMPSLSLPSRRLTAAITTARQAGELALIASLPVTDPEYARAAVRGGAHALKVHFGLTHRASGKRAATLHEQPDVVARLRDIAPELPLGAVLGSDANAVEQELDLVQELGLDFVSGYVHALPASIHQSELEVLLAFDDQTPTTWAGALHSDMLLEASVTKHTEYGLPLTAADLLQYRTLRGATNAKLVVPTQKHIRPAEALILRDLGVDALMYGVVVTGEGAEGFEQVAREYRQAFHLI